MYGIPCGIFEEWYRLDSIVVEGFLPLSSETVDARSLDILNLPPSAFCNLFQLKFPLPLDRWMVYELALWDRILWVRDGAVQMVVENEHEKEELEADLVRLFEYKGMDRSVLKEKVVVLLE